MTDLRMLCAVGIGAALGGILRYAVAQAFVQRFGSGFPYGTLFINISGSFLIGLTAELAASSAGWFHPTLRTFVATGILGGYTTFSTFSLDSLNLMDQGWYPAMLYIGASVLLGTVGAALGAACARVVVLR